ncbi:unnamed protein product [Strongylus vulgaris]|uniref:Uncharacterized protein n=1 Tax=Strongylus vulgaris TaxID=40348 RepID=A0A3P7JNQ6_STRVU|nr:unnamed protein product [Strongylus vulgaris]
MYNEFMRNIWRVHNKWYSGPVYNNTVIAALCREGDFERTLASKEILDWNRLHGPNGLQPLVGRDEYGQNDGKLGG